MVSRFLIALALAAAAPALAAPYVRPPNHAATSLDAAAGWAIFKRPWISAPSTLTAAGGIGPLYSARSCNACHAGAGPGAVGEGMVGDGAIVRLGHADGGGDAVYGVQLQTLALPGFEPEAEAALHWEIAAGLRTPRIALSALHYGALDPQTHAGLRRAPSLFGIGRLEAIPESEILAHAGAGKPAWLDDGNGGRTLGRFGWKAAVPTIARQVAIAFQRDFGISSSELPGAFGECTFAEKDCRDAPGAEVELPDSFHKQVTTFLRLLRSPAQLNEASPGFALFRSSGCLECHATLKDARGAPVPAYTDLLLHDLGPALDDNIAEGAATGSEWRTAPLWDVADSLSQGGLLHDGRARSIAEAVQWHGGQASQARSAFNALSPKERKLIDDFLLGH